MALKIVGKDGIKTQLSETIPENTTLLNEEDIIADIELTPPTKVKKHLKEKLGTAQIPADHATIGFSSTYTKNLGNYESYKVQVSLHHPVGVDINNVDPDVLSLGFDWIRDWVEGKMSTLIEDIETPEKQDNTKYVPKTTDTKKEMVKADIHEIPSEDVATNNEVQF
jgi:hypothetical protein